MLVSEHANYKNLRNNIMQYADALASREVETLSYNELGWLRCISSSAAMAAHKSTTNSAHSKSYVLNGQTQMRVAAKPTLAQVRATFTREELLAMLTDESEAVA